MEKTIKVVVCGELTESGSLNAEIRRTIRLTVDPFETQKRVAVLKEVLERFGWLAFVPTKNVHLTWIDDEGDCISIFGDADMDLCFELGGPVPKIFINIVDFGQPPPKAATAASTSTAAAAVPATTCSSQTEQPATAASASAAILHANIICDGCNTELRGCRYKCTQCADFDLCQACLERNPHAQHIMLRMPLPSSSLGSGGSGGLTERRLCKWLSKHIPAAAPPPPTAANCASGLEGAADCAGRRAGGGGGRRAAASARRHQQQQHQRDWRLQFDQLSGLYRSVSDREPPRAAAGGSSSSSSGNSSSCASAAAPPLPPRPTSMPTATAAPVFASAAAGAAAAGATADHIAVALGHARTAEKAAAAGFELLSKFTAILDPFGANLAEVLRDVAGGGAEQQQQQPEAAEFAAAQRASEQAVAAGRRVAEAEAAAKRAEAMSAQAQAVAAEAAAVAATAAKQSSSTGEREAEQRPDEPEASGTSMRSADSVDSVLEALLEATKDAKKDNYVGDRQKHPDVD